MAFHSAGLATCLFYTLAAVLLSLTYILALIQFFTSLEFIVVIIILSVRTGSLLCLSFIGLGIGGILIYKLYSKFFLHTSSSELASSNDVGQLGAISADECHSTSMGNQLYKSKHNGYFDNKTFVDGLELRENPIFSSQSQRRHPDDPELECEDTPLLQSHGNAEQGNMDKSDEWSEYLQGGQSSKLPVYVVDEHSQQLFNRIVEISAKHDRGGPKFPLQIELRSPLQKNKERTTPSDPLSFSPHEDSDLDEDMDFFRRRTKSCSGGPQPRNLDASYSCSSCTELAASSSKTCSMSHFSGMDDSGVDFILREDNDSDHLLRSALERIRHLYEDLSDMRTTVHHLEGKHERFSDALHAHSTELLAASQLLEEIRLAEEASPLLSHSSSFDMDFLRRSSSQYEQSDDDILQGKITELCEKAGLGDLVVDDVLRDSKPEVLNIGHLQPIEEYARSEWSGGTSRAETMIHGYLEVLKHGPFLRRVRGDNFCALRASLFQLFHRNLDLPNSCDYWQQHLSFAFSKFPWLNQWSFASNEHLASHSHMKKQVSAESVQSRLSSCLRTLYSERATFLSVQGDLHRDWETFFSFNARTAEDLQMMEALKVLMMLRAVELQSADSRPDYAMLLFARDSSYDLRSFFTNHLNKVGVSGGLEQVEMLLLADVLEVKIEVFRPGSFGLPDFHSTFSPDDERELPVISLISEDDRHYNLLMRS